jgi:hypothetical protein
MLPAAEDAKMEKPEIPETPSDNFLYVLIKDPTSGLYMLIFDYETSRISYFIDEGLTCIGWSKTTLEKDISYYFNENPGFEAFSAEHFPDGLPYSNPTGVDGE